MIKIPYILPEITYTKLPYAEFAATFNEVKGAELVDLGVCSDGVNHIYCWKIGEFVRKPVIYIEGSIHGAHEWRCGYWVKKFAQYLTDNTTPYWNLFSKLRSKFDFVIIPTLNPFGYVNYIYENANGVNLNRNFDVNWSAQPGWGTGAFSEVETKIVKSLIETYKPVLAIDCHTEGSSKGAIATIPRHSSLPNGIYTEFLSEALTACAVALNEEKDIQIGVASKADCWFTKNTSKIGRPTIGVTIEAGGGETEPTQAKIGLNILLYMCVYAMEFYEKRKMNTYN
ncbi:hypothetical protein bcgnr5372_28230 [Bacillus luti]